MHAALLLSSLVAFFATAVSSTALTYKLAANEKSCFFAHVNQKSAKVAFYFAVRPRSSQPLHSANLAANRNKTRRRGEMASGRL